MDQLWKWATVHTLLAQRNFKGTESASPVLSIYVKADTLGHHCPASPRAYDCQQNIGLNKPKSCSHYKEASGQLSIIEKNFFYLLF